MIDGGEDDDTLDLFQGTLFRLCKPTSSKAVAALGILRVLNAESNEEKATICQTLC